MTLRTILQYISKRKMILLIGMRIYLSGFNVLFSYLVQRSINTVLYQNGSGLSILIALNITLILSFMLVYYLFQTKVVEMTQMINLEMGKRLIQGVFFNDEESSMTEGKLMNLFSQDIETITNFISYGLIPMIDMALTLIFGVGFLLFNVPLFAILFLVTGLFIGYCSYRNAKGMEGDFGNYLAANDAQQTYLEQIYRMFPIISIFKIERWIQENYEPLFSNRRDNFRQYNRRVVNAYLLSEGSIFVMQIFSLLIGLVMVGAGKLPVGTVIGAQNAGLGSVLYPASVIPTYFDYCTQYKISLERVNQHLYELNSTQEVSKRASASENSSNYPLTFEQVTFTYGEKPVLKNFNYTFPKEGLVYIVGPSGIGKSTLFRLVLGDVLPENGIIQLPDGTDEVAYVPQKNHLFPTSIRDNLTLGADIAEEKVKAVCQEMNIWTVIKALPQGLDTIYGKSIQLSQGQMKRLSIARALLSESNLVLMDEPFADLDLNNQKGIIQYLRKNEASKLILIITHTGDFIEADDTIIRLGESL
ncbi:ABC transporter ATP-binding protein [Aerococcaceae bacterium zg-ZJ1578]|uniref:ATP-binding cassette domain-containing protein n=1 Tax=Aerococcaceae bacterium zg-252 TaxID=2796928 RepID=UPI001A32A8F4|nr:ABC transporter ATP-binding protein [Aerococcaceae bacterium zg-1578]